MRTSTLLALSLTLSAGVARAEPERAKDPRADHVVLVSIDGLRPEFYLDPSWPAPTLQRLAKEGVRAQAVRGVFPSVTYPSHTTLITGALPARHGIVNNEPFEPEGQTGRWYWDASEIKARTLWHAVQDAGLESASISWPVSVGAPVTRNLPEVWSLSAGIGGTAPIRSASTPPGLMEEIEREATGNLRDDNYSMNLASRDLRVGLAAGYLLRTYRPALLTVHLTGPDHVMHAVGRQGPEVAQAVALADAALATLVEDARRAGILERTAFVVTGDHGFVDTHTRVCPNVWLAEAGLQGSAPDRGAWRATFHCSGGSALLRLADPADAAAVEVVRGLLAELPPGVRKTFRVIEPAQLRELGADPDAALALSAFEGYRFSSSARGKALQAGRGGTHGYFPDFQRIHTGFVGWGAGFAEDVLVPRLDLEDVAPVVAELLGIGFEAPDGVLPIGLLRAAR
ncbi:MAG: alkaline phosphatase family protein [Planctomycetes bacterium]|nr:alkaline phosphatase family protein [Planctomycetota bacterium]